MLRARVAVLVAMAAAMSVASLASPATANWLSRLTRGAGELGEAGTAVGKLGVAAFDGAAAYVARLPRVAKGNALAAHVTPEGHWKFASREGDVFTAATPEELARVRSVLVPDAAPGATMSLYLSEDTVFAGRAHLKDLPRDAELHVVAGDGAYPLRTQSGAAGPLVAEVRPGIVVLLTDRALFEETVFRLGRALNRSNIRVLALEPGGPRRLSSVPRYDPATKAALVDQVDPAALSEALTSLRGQTALVTGRVEGGRLTFQPSSGANRDLDVATLVAAANAADVNLIVVNASAPLQPGGRNWLWQKVAVAGLDDALGRATFGDFLSALVGAGSEVSVTAARGAQDRVALSAVPVPNTAGEITGTLTEWLGDVTGHMTVRAAEVHARTEAEEVELDARLLPAIPSAVQYAYLGALVMGLLAWQVTGAWWSRLWPPEERKDYAGPIGYATARLARGLAFLLLFLPAAGLPAFVWLCLLQLWSVVTAPARLLAWLRGRLFPGRA